MRFTLQGEISTPIGPHKPISPNTFAMRVWEWHARVQNTTFLNQSFEKIMAMAEEGDLIYCDPPYLDSQAILYGAQTFDFEYLIEMIAECKRKGARVALSIDGKKKSGRKNIDLQIPAGIFTEEIYLDCGSSMLKRFQNGGQIMIGEDVHDRLLLTW
jgi:DNA adenine methylase